MKTLILNLHKTRLPNVNKIIKIPDIDVFTTQEGVFYGVYYFLHTNKGVAKIRFTSTCIMRLNCLLL